MKDRGHIFFILLMVMITACGSDTETTSVPDNPIPSAEIGFSSYVGGNGTRASVEDESTIATKGFGVYAMYTKGGKYDPSSSSDNDTTTFSPAFMKNVKVTKSGDSWGYDLHRFWPSTSSEYVSFLAYAPYNANQKLYSLSSTTSGASVASESGDSTYIKYSIGSVSGGSSSAGDPSATIDLMYNANDALNRQCYLQPGETSYTKTENVSDKGAVLLNFKHATARIGFSITSSALASSGNFAASATTGTKSITVTKVMFIGKAEDEDDDAGAKPHVHTRAHASSADSPTGAFYMEGYLNLNLTATEADRWVVANTNDKVYFTFSSFTTDGSTSGNSISASRTGTSGNGTATTIQNANTDYLFIIPQDFSADGTSASTIGVTDQDSGGGPEVSNERALYCYVKYTVTDGTKTKDKTATGSVSNNFKAGEPYVIKIDLSDISIDDSG